MSVSMDPRTKLASPVAEMDGVSFSYDGVRVVLHDVSIALESGQAYALVGPNGAGKSTIVGLLTGLWEPTVGQVTLDGRSAGVDRRAGSASVQQQLSLFPHLSVAENLLLGLQELPFGIRTRGRAYRLAHERLATIGADLPLDARCGDLPFAARQLVEIARALSREPRVLCLDEPTSALDRSAKQDLYAALRRVRESGTTILLVTHDPSEVRAIDATPIYVSEGRIVDGLSGPISATGTGFVPRADGAGGAEPLDVRIANRLRGIHFTCSVAPGAVTLASFDDALERSESVASFLRNDANIFASIRNSGTWRLLPDARLPTVIRVVSGSKHDYNVFPHLTTQENAVLLSARRKVPAFRSKRIEAGLLDSLQRRARIEYPSAQSRFIEMSGGNQQRMVLAALTHSAPDLLVAEEPLMGVDERSLETIAALLWDYAAAGGRVLVATCFPDTYRPWAARRLTVAFTGSHESCNALS